MKLLTVLFLLFLLITGSAAQNASQREWKIFRKGVSEYQNGNYDLALQSFSLMLNKLPNSALTTANFLMLAKTNYKAGNFTVSLEQCQAFLNRFPRSAYRDDILLLTGNNYYRLNRMDAALKQWLVTVRESTDPEIRNKAWRLALDVARYKINRFTLEQMEQNNSDGFVRPALSLLVAEKLWHDGKKKAAREKLTQARARTATPPLSAYAERLGNLFSGKTVNEWHVALLLPLSGENAELGKDFKQGVELAVGKYNKLHGKPIVLKTFDYKGQLIPALQRMREIADDPNILFVFGPLENDITAACATMANYEGLTLVSPTATEAAITQISANSILLSPTLETQSRILASFAVDSLKLNRFAALTPLDDYFLRLEGNFKNTLLENGADMAAEEWYIPGDQSFKKQFKILKRIGLKLSFADSVLLEQPMLTQHEIDSSYRAWQKDIREKMKETKTKIDSVDLEVTAFDGLFLPVYREDIGLMASQFAFANIKTQLLGNSDWYDLRELKKNRNYINGLIFASDGYLNENDWNYRQFRNSFRDRFKSTPSRYALIAYDSFSYISAIFSDDGNLTRTEIRPAIVGLPDTQGLFRKFAIDQTRTNRAVNILKYMYDQLIPLQ